MAFNFDLWKESTKRKLQGWKGRMERGGTNSAYYFLAGASLFPVVQAVHSGDWSGLAVLGASLGGAVSTNLLANIVQKSKDKSDAEIAKILETEAKSSPELNAELNVLIEKLNTLNEAEKALADSDKGWFVETIQRELKNINLDGKYDAMLDGIGAIAQGDGAKAVGAGGILVEGNLFVNQSSLQQGPKTLSLIRALQHYLDSIIATHKYLRLQGIRAGSQPLSVALENVYISLTMDTHIHGDSGILTIDAALQSYQRLVIIGDPGCGKTTLLSYIALTYARTLRENVDLVKDRLGLLGFSESENLPILLSLRDLGRHLLEKHLNPGKDGPAILLDYLLEYYQAQEIDLPADFFSAYLEKGKSILLLDGMDEVANITLRQRVARLIEKFSDRYPKCRFIVTSREVGYDGATRVGAQFGLAKVRAFSTADVHKFIRNWTRVVEITLANLDVSKVLRFADAQADKLVEIVDTNLRVIDTTANPSWNPVLREADAQANKLIEAVDANSRIADLAENPLLLTVIALVHRYRAQLPERRSELYEEVVEALLGHWDEAKGLDQDMKLAGTTMDSGDRRSLLEPVAFWMHERNQREIERDDLRTLLLPVFKSMTGSDGQADKALDDFLRVVNERSGLLIERSIGIYSFAHHTFQEYLAARALADRKDAMEFTLKHLPDTWWREVILLQMGYLSTQSKRRVSELISAIMNADPKTKTEPHYFILLAVECLIDVGPARVEGDLLGKARKSLKKKADAKSNKASSVLSKITASNALARLDSGRVAADLWKPPYGETEVVNIPVGEFWMGGEGKQDGKPVHKVFLPEYKIARVPVTNVQYAFYVQDAKVRPPEHWRSGDLPPGFENHPVVNVTWHDALAYCKWLGVKIQKQVTLPSEAEWEKAARGSKDKRNFPWGNNWHELYSNSKELGLGITIPVGLFLKGASPYGVLDMSGNVWEWTRNVYKEYPYSAEDGRENLSSKETRSIRGGSFLDESGGLHCACRHGLNPNSKDWYRGFRVVVKVSPMLIS